MSLQSRLAAESKRNTNYISELRASAGAPGAAQQSASHIGSLRQRLFQAEAELKRLEARRLSYKSGGSGIGRLASKLSGKSEQHAAKQQQEDQQHVDALQSEHRLQKERDYLQRELATTEKSHIALNEAAQRYATTQREFDSFYESIFGGPTPDLPREDAAESRRDNAFAGFNQACAWRDSTVQIQSLLQNAATLLTVAVQDVAQAVHSSRLQQTQRETGPHVSVAGRNGMIRAQANAREAEKLLVQARALDPSIHTLGPIDLLRGDMTRDLSYGHGFAVYELYQRLTAAQHDLSVAVQTVSERRAQCDQVIKGAQASLGAAGAAYDNARAELQNIRSEAFANAHTKSLT